MRRSLLLLLSSLLVLVAPACGGSEPSPTPTPTSLPAGPPFELGKTHTFTQLGFSMAYPVGWKVGYSTIASGEATTHLSQLPEDHARLKFGRSVAGYQVMYGWLGAGAMSVNDVPRGNVPRFIQWMKTELGYEASGPPDKADVFGAPALRTTGVFGLGLIAECLVGNPGKFWYFLCFGALSEEALEEFMPTLERMLASIKPVDR